MNHWRISPIKLGSSHSLFISRWEVNDAWVKGACGGVTLPRFKCITRGSDPPLSSLWCADPLWRWEMPQSDSYCIDFPQPANTCYTNAILLLLAAANQGVGDNAWGDQQLERLRLQAHAIHPYSHNEGLFRVSNQPDVCGFKSKEATLVNSIWAFKQEPSHEPLFNPLPKSYWLVIS